MHRFLSIVILLVLADATAWAQSPMILKPDATPNPTASTGEDASPESSAPAESSALPNPAPDIAHESASNTNAASDTVPPTPMPNPDTQSTESSKNSLSVTEATRREKEISQLIAGNKTDEALPKAQKYLADCETSGDKYNPILLNAISILADLYRNTGQPSNALPLYQRMHDIVTHNSPTDSHKLAVIRNNIGLSYIAIGDMGNAELHLKEAVVLQEKVKGPNDPSLMSILNNLAELYRIQHQFDKAEPVYQRIVQIGEAGNKSKDQDLLTQLGLAYNNHGLIAKQQSRYDVAEPLLQKAVATYEKLYGPKHPDVASSLINLGAIYKNQGQFEKAEGIYQRALSILENTLGPDHADLPRALNNISGLYFFQGNMEQAESLVKRALDIAVKNHGLTNHPDVMISLTNLETIYVKMGKPEEVTKVQEKLDLVRYGPKDSTQAASK